MEIGRVPSGVERIESRIREINEKIQSDHKESFAAILKEKKLAIGSTAAVKPDGAAKAAEEKNQQGKEDPQLRKVAQDMEALFVNQLLSEMRRTVNKSGLLDNTGTETFEGMLDEKMSDKISDSGGIGLSDIIYEQLKLYK